MSAVSLIAVVAAVIGKVTALVFRSHMYGKLHDQLRSTAEPVLHRGPGPLPRGARR
ncbi:hypothetical protein Sfulv_31270 [Streptomyces fulvorobeus]|uniref:Uncharacterized protein n=1 Tax=Streptomyces fulvorobeus TaxID=284028 RepID=A0A7J0C9A5_9ACTN|nr:hypothetical protein [Streptomyces fulvorobeus]NYE41943.1 hypothetical protein [Streptomyces fulvorobeus]GFM98316.1 hypothetical protein Sfulv_31270 [Streptomyces fulvorobeus]